MTTSADSLQAIAQKLDVPTGRLRAAIGEGWIDATSKPVVNPERKDFSADYLRKSSTGYDVMISIDSVSSTAEDERSVSIGSPKGTWISVATVAYTIGSQTMKFPLHQAHARFTEIQNGVDEAEAISKERLKHCTICDQDFPPEFMSTEPGRCMGCATQHHGILY